MNHKDRRQDILQAAIEVFAKKGFFASRVSESLLSAMALSELVGSNQDDMVRIAKRVANDTSA